MYSSKSYVSPPPPPPPTLSPGRRRYSQFSLPGGFLEQTPTGSLHVRMNRRPSMPSIHTDNSRPRLSERLTAYDDRCPDRAFTPTSTISPRSAEPSLPSSQDMLELMTEVHDLWEQLNSHITVSQSRLYQSPPHTPQSMSHTFPHDSVMSRNILHTEMNNPPTVSDHCDIADSDGSTASQDTQRTTMSSLRRRLGEKEAEFDALKRRHTMAEMQSHRLEETVNMQRSSIEHLERDRIALNDELMEIRQYNDNLARKLEGAKYRNLGMREDHTRQQRTMNKFREELVSAHQNALSARLEARQAKERAIELEKQQKERRMSSEAISSRIVELRAIHDEMLMLFSSAEDDAAGLSNGRRRNTSSQGGERRSGMLNQLRKILSPKSPETDKPLQLVPSATGETVSMERHLRGMTHRPLNGMGQKGSKLTTLTSTSAMRGSTDGEGGNQRSFLCGISKTGMGLNRMRMSSRSSRAATMLASIERTRAAVEKDTEVLRELIQMKDGELERIRNELYLARRKTETLEQALAGQKQRRRKESRRHHGSSRRGFVKNEELESKMSMLCLSQSLMHPHAQDRPQMVRNEAVETRL